MAQKFLNGIDVLSTAVVDGSNLNVGSTVLDVQGTQGQLFSVTSSLTGDLFSVSDISGIPILNVNSSGAVDIDGNLNLGDNHKIQLGSSQDLQIYHDGSNSYISEVGAGDLIISADNDLTFKDGSGNIMANMNASNSVELMYGNVKKFETASAGVTITGNISAITASGHAFMLGNSTNTTTADTSGFRLYQSTYTDGRWAHRLRKYDQGGGVPLYIDASGNTANIFTALARFGTYTGEAKTFEVFGDMGATNFSGSSSGTNTGDQDLSGYSVTSHNHDDRYYTETETNKHTSNFIGWVSAYGDSTESNVRWNVDENAVEIQSATDTTTGASYKAQRVTTGQTIRVTLMVKASTSAGAGLYLRLYQHNGDMPDGKTHVSHNSNASSVVVQEEDESITNWIENAAVTTDWVTYEKEYTVLADGYISLVVLNWTGIGTNSLYVTTPDIQTVRASNSDKLDGQEGTHYLDYSNFGTAPTWNQNTTGNAATTTLAANSTQLNGFTLARIDHAQAFHTFDNIDADSTQAKRYHIGRLYGCPAHWDGDWQNIEFNVTAESYESGHLRYRLMGDYGGAGSQANMINLYLKEASGPMVGRFRFVLGTPVDAGWDYSGQDTFYVDLYAEASHYSQWKINIKTYGHGTQNSNPTSGAATTVLYDSPTVTNITTFNEGHTAIHHLGDEIYHEGHLPTLAELGAAANTVVNQTDFVSAASGGTFGGTVNISPGTSAVGTLTLRRDTTGDSTIVGDVNFNTSAAQATDDRIGLVRVQTSGGDATTRGGEMRLYTRQSGSANFNTTIYDKAGNWSLPSNLTVGGNLTVEGTVTTLNTSTVEVEDNILQLNTTQATTDTATAATSGISVYRGVDENDVVITQASLIFDDGDDTWDLTNNLTIAGDVIGASFAVPSGASTGFLKADGSVDSTTYSGYTFGATDLTFSGADPGDIVWKDADGTEVHRIWSGTADYLTYRNDAGTTYELISAGSTTYNNANWDTAYTHSQAAHAPTNAEQNVQSDWNATTGDALILNKPTIPSDFVSAASGGTFSGDLIINADVTINGSTDESGAVTPRLLDFTTNPTAAGLAGSTGYQIGEISFTGKDSSTNAAGKYSRIRGSIVDSNTTVQGSGGEGGKLQFTLLKHDAGAQPRVEYDILTLTPLVADVDGQLDVSGNIRLIGGGTIEAPSTSGAEDLILKAAGGVDVIIDSNGNGGDTEIFRVMHHTSAVLFEVQEGGEVRFQDGIRISGTEDRISSVGSSMYIGGGGFGNSLVQFSGKPIPDSSYSFDFGASNRYWNQCYLGTIHLGSTLLSNQSNTDIDSAAAEMVAQVAIATYTAAFFDFVVKKSTNVRSGTVYACHDGTNVEFTETATADLGDTSDVVLSVDISGGNMRLIATVASNDWSVKSLIRAI